MQFRRVRESEASGARLAAALRLQGLSVAALTREVNAAGYRTTRGGPWHPASMGTYLDNPAIAGLVEADGELVPGGGPTLIPPSDFLAIRAMRPSNNPDSAPKSEPREYVVPPRLGVCGLCGAALTTSPPGSASAAYRCRKLPDNPTACGKVRVKAELLETYLAEIALAELAKPAVKAVLIEARDAMLAEAERLRADVTAAGTRQRELGKQYAAGGLSMEAFRAADQELKRSIREAKRQASFLERVRHVPIAGVPDLVRWWEHAPLKSKQGILVLLFEKVALYPAVAKGSRTVDADRVGLTWRKWGEAASGAAVAAPDGVTSD
ncbi:recombinase family protein [Streptomyces noursei]|uniref:recombinase family protein n=1 Tax=Streptomyces noursei TaxID=1971 RepID=UPI0036D2F135